MADISSTPLADYSLATTDRPKVTLSGGPSTADTMAGTPPSTELRRNRRVSARPAHFYEYEVLGDAAAGGRLILKYDGAHDYTRAETTVTAALLAVGADPLNPAELATIETRVMEPFVPWEIDHVFANDVTDVQLRITAEMTDTAASAGTAWAEGAGPNPADPYNPNYNADRNPYAGSTYTPPAPTPAEPVITTDRLPALTVGVAADVQIEATGDEPIGWTVLAGEIDGMELDTAGRLAGTPAAAGVYMLEIQAMNAAGTDSATYLGVVAAAAADLAATVAAFIGRPDDEKIIAQAAVHVPIVAEYVRGYTRGRGFTGDQPAAPLAAVIVSACARLTANPRQVTTYSSGDYSERPAILAGWTLAELGVLRRYRRISA